MCRHGIHYISVSNISTPEKLQNCDKCSFVFCLNQDLQRCWARLQVVAWGDLEAAFLMSVLHFGSSGWYVHLYTDTWTFLLRFMFFFFGMHNIEAWMNSGPAAVWWIQSDTMQKYSLVSASFIDWVLFSASVKCSGMSTSIYLINAHDTKVSYYSQLWYKNRNERSSVHVIILFEFTDPRALLCQHPCPGTVPMVLTWSFSDHMSNVPRISKILDIFIFGYLNHKTFIFSPSLSDWS